MNTNENDSENGGDEEPGFWRGLAQDKGVQHGVAGTAVAVGIAIVKRLIFSKGR